jgi:hypothetical protein
MDWAVAAGHTPLERDAASGIADWGTGTETPEFSDAVV